MNQQEIGKTREEIDERFVPINFTVVVSLPNGRQVQASSSFYGVPGADENALLDKMMAALERQRAKVEIEEFDEEIEKHEESIAKAEGEIQGLHAGTDKQIAALQAEFGEQATKLEATVNDLKAAKEEQGRTFDEDRPGNKAKLQPFKNRQAEISEKIAKLKSERDVGEKNFRANMAHFADAVEKLKKKRASRVARVG